MAKRSKPTNKSQPSAGQDTKSGKTRKSFGRRLWDFVRSWGTVILIVLAIRAFVIEAFTVPTGSMEDTILPGDFLLVNKFVYGFKSPFSNADIIPGRGPKQGDIIVFRYPRNSRWLEPDQRYTRFFFKWLPLLPIYWDRKDSRFRWYAPQNYVKRCIGLPGDTVEIVNKQLYVNGQPYAAQGKAKFKDHNTYQGLVPREDFNQRWLELVAIRFADSLHYSDTLVYQSALSSNQLNFAQIRSYYDTLFYSARERANFAQIQDSTVYASLIMHYYMRDNFGPIVVPESCVFAMGDNRDYSEDCRYWGFVPIDQLKGTPLVIYYSLGDPYDNAGRRRNLLARILGTHWNRIGTVID